MANTRGAYACAGTTRKGRPCGNTVGALGDLCDRCAAPEPLPVFEPPALSLVPSDDAVDPWTPSASILERLAPLATANPLLEELVDVCMRLARSSRAESSKRAYEHHWATFAEFCGQYGLDASMPVAPETVVLFVAWLAAYGRLNQLTGERDGNGEPLAHGYIRQAVSAIAHRHAVAGLASPTDNIELASILRGYGREHGVATDGKDPLRIEGVTKIAAMLAGPSRLGARNRAILLLATHPQLDLNAGQIGRLKGTHVIVPTKTLEPIVLLVHPGGRSLGLNEVEVSHEHDEPDACAACALIDLDPPRHGHVFTSRNGAPLARQNIAKIVCNGIAANGLSSDAVAGGSLPRLEDASARARLGRAALETGAAEIRDHALILIWYWGCFRGEELSEANWHHATRVNEGIEFNVAFAKTDQLGIGDTVGIPFNNNPLLCPVRALDRWHETLQTLLGRTLTPMDPLFGRIEPATGQLARLSREALSHAVARRTKAAGVDGDISGHSLRAGFVVDAIDKGIPREQIQHHGRWKNISSLDPYCKKSCAFGPNNPAQALSKQAATVSDLGPSALPSDRF